MGHSSGPTARPARPVCPRGCLCSGQAPRTPTAAVQRRGLPSPAHRTPAPREVPSGRVSAGLGVPVRGQRAALLSFWALLHREGGAGGAGLRGALKTSAWQPLSRGGRGPGEGGRGELRPQGCTGPHRRGGIQSRAHATSVTSFLANGSDFKQLHCLVGACRSHTLPKESLRPVPAPACHPACGVKPWTPKRQLTSPLKGQPESRGHQVEAKQGLSRTLSSEPLLRCAQPSASGLPFPGKAGATFLGGQTRGLAPPCRTSRSPADKVWAA